jgi:hypothetical protein
MYSNFFEANEAAKSARSLASELRGAREPVYVFREFETLSALPFQAATAPPQRITLR